jgi:hypothetical protein
MNPSESKNNTSVSISKVGRVAPDPYSSVTNSFLWNCKLAFSDKKVYPQKILFVIDISESMKICFRQLVTNITTTFDMLPNSTKVGFIFFNHEILYSKSLEGHVSLQSEDGMDGEFCELKFYKEKLITMLKGIRPHGATNVHGALLTASNYCSREQSVDVYVFSDGASNAGLRGNKMMNEIMKLKLFANPLNTVSTVGIGLEYVPKQLYELSKLGRGVYYNAPFAEEYAEVFKVIVSNMMSSVFGVTVE